VFKVRPAIADTFLAARDELPRWCLVDCVEGFTKPLFLCRIRLTSSSRAIFGVGSVARISRHKGNQNELAGLEQMPRSHQDDRQYLEILGAFIVF